jgi:hypothetical protein
MLMTGIKIDQLTSSGFVHLIDIDIDPETSNEKDQGQLIDEMTERIYKAKDLFLINHKAEAIIIRDIPHNTFRITKIMKETN